MWTLGWQAMCRRAGLTAEIMSLNQGPPGASESLMTWVKAHFCLLSLVGSGNFFFFFETRSFSISLETTMQIKLALNSQKSTYLCSPVLGLKRVPLRPAQWLSDLTLCPL